MVSWTCQHAVLNWPMFRSRGVFRLRGTTAISQQARAVEGLLGNMSSRSILEGGCRGKVLPRCIFGLPATARLCLDAFPGARRWQNAREMRSWSDWQWQYSRAVRSRVSIRGNVSPRCVPGRPSVTIFSPHASQKWPRTGKSPLHGKIRAPCIRKRAGFGKICAPCIRKALQTVVWGYTTRRSCQEGALFAAQTPRIMHDARILPFLGVSFGCCGRGEGRGGARGAGAAHAARARPRFVRGGAVLSRVHLMQL